MIKVYLSSPYTKGDTGENVRLQMDTFHQLMDLGYNPMVPLLSHFLHIHKGRHYEDWMKIDIDWIEVMDVVLRIPSDIPSSGADRECEHAIEIGVPVVYSIEELLEKFPIK